MAQQLVKKSNGGYENVMPKSWIDAIVDKSTGKTLTDILQSFNMYFLSYSGNTMETRCQIPSIIRKKGLWITYVKYDGKVYTEWYAASAIDDKSWGDSSNWRVANNNLVGDISISANGNWVINGDETAHKAVGERGDTPMLRVYDNKLQVSYDEGDTWTNVTENPVYTKFRWFAETPNIGRIQVSTDGGATWVDMSNNFTNNLKIKRYIGADETPPTSDIQEGDIYAKGPFYDASDTSHQYPTYRLLVYAWKGNTLAWQDHGEFTSIPAGIVQEEGNNENVVMSQDAVTRTVNTLQDNILSSTGISEYPVFSNRGTYAIGDIVRYEGKLYKFIVEHELAAWNPGSVEEWSEKKEREEKVRELDLELKKEVDAEPKQSLSSSYITENGGIGIYEHFVVKVFEVKEGDLYHITFAGAGPTIACEYAIYSSDSLTADTAIKVGEKVISGYDEYISIPSGAAIIAIQYQIGAKFVTIKKLEKRISAIEDNIKYLEENINAETNRAEAVEAELQNNIKSINTELTNTTSSLNNGLKNVEQNIGNFVFDKSPMKAKSVLLGKQLNDDGSLRDYVYDKIEIIPITEGELYNIKGQTIGYDTHLFAFYSSDVISSDTLVEIGPKLYEGSKVTDVDYYAKAPIGATHLAVCVYQFSITTISKPLAAYEGIYSSVLKENISNLGDVRKEVDTLNSAVFAESAVSVEGEYIAGKQLQMSGSISASEPFGIYKYKVNPGERYHFSREKDVGSTGSLTYAIYSSEDANSNTAIELGPEFDDPIDLTITIPEGAVLMVVGKVTTHNIAVSKLELVSRFENLKYTIPNFAVEVSEEDVSITRRYSETEDIRVTLKKCGPNKLMQIFSHSFVNNTDRIPSFSSASVVKQSGSDWIGPYVIKADNREGTYTGFTGGWHGYNGNQTGAKTGDTIDVRILVDNRKEDVGRYYCNNVKVVVTNLIQGGNTKAEDGNGINVLKEIVTYHFKENRIYVSVVITALEDISFNIYYGMQVNNYNQSIRYFADNIVYKGWSDGENRTDKKNLQFIICEGTDGRYVKAAMDIVGLGMREYSNPSKYAFVSGAKAYYSLVDAGHKKLSLVEGEQAYWKGYYEFMNTSSVDEV